MIVHPIRFDLPLQLRRKPAAATRRVLSNLAVLTSSFKIRWMASSGNFPPATPFQRICRIVTLAGLVFLWICCLASFPLFFFLSIMATDSGFNAKTAPYVFGLLLAPLLPMALVAGSITLLERFRKAYPIAMVIVLILCFLAGFYLTVPFTKIWAGVLFHKSSA
jgi:hypothetical protein